MINVGVIGCGYWGPNILRNLNDIANCTVIKLCDLKEGRLEYVRNLGHRIEVTKDYRDIINDHRIDAVFLATPPETHFALASEIINSGKHLFVEKPLATCSRDAQKLVELSRAKDSILMVGHLFIYNPAVIEIRKLLNSRRIGDVFYINSYRLNLPPPRSKLNVVWDLACHDVSIVLDWLSKDPEEIIAYGKTYTKTNVEDMAYIIIFFPDSIVVNIHVSWLMPGKLRQTYIIGSKGVIVYDDTLSDGRVKIYDEGIDTRIGTSDTDSIRLFYGAGSVTVPNLSNVEPLRLECQHFIDCILRSETPITDGESGLKTVKVLELACRSMRSNGKAMSFK